MEIKLKYDPYRMKTSLNIDGRDVLERSAGYEKICEFMKQNIPIQSWLDPISFMEWDGLLPEIIGNSNEQKVDFHFWGRETDFSDIEEAIKRQAQKEINGKYDIDVCFDPHFIYSDKIILERVNEAYKLIATSEFKSIIHDSIFNTTKNSSLQEAYENLSADYKKAVDTEFRIVFSGMYSSGKSTIINAILGKEILPMSDNTCTKKIFEVRHDPSSPYASMQCVDKNGNVIPGFERKEYTRDSLKERFKKIFPKETNDSTVPEEGAERIEKVQIYTHIPFIEKNDSEAMDAVNIVLVDTPGTSSGEGIVNGHIDIVKKVVESDKKEIVVFATSANEAELDSIQPYLEMMDKNFRKEAYNQRFFFVLNKADLVEFREDETWDTQFNRIKKYYEQKARNIETPRFFPTCAVGAMRVRNNDPFHSYQTVFSRYYIDGAFDEEGRTVKTPNPYAENYYFDEYCSTSLSIKEAIKADIETYRNKGKKKAELWAHEIEMHSGIPSLEEALAEYIVKYAVPLKIQDLVKTYDTIFQETRQRVNIVTEHFNAAQNKYQNAEQGKKDLSNEGRSKINDKEEKERIKDELKKEHDDLENLSREHNRSLEETIVDIKSKMRSGIDSAKRTAREKQDSKDSINSQIKGIIDNKQKECVETIKSAENKYLRSLEEINSRVKKLYDRLKNIELDKGFTLGNTVAFQEASTEQINNIEKGLRSNPDYYEGWNIFKALYSIIFLPKEIPTAMNLEKLNDTLVAFQNDFNNNIDNALAQSKQRSSDFLENVKNNLQKVQRCIENLESDITEMKRRINEASNNVDEAKKLVDKLRKYNELLKTINIKLDF